MSEPKISGLGINLTETIQAILSYCYKHCKNDLSVEIPYDDMTKLAKKEVDKELLDIFHKYLADSKFIDGPQSTPIISTYPDGGRFYHFKITWRVLVYIEQGQNT